MKYTIFQVDDSRQDNVDTIRERMVGWEEYPNVAVNGLKLADDNKYVKYVPRYIGMTLGQLGVWASFQHALSLAPILTLDDDAILERNASIIASKYVEWLPDDADFFALYTPPQFASMYKESKHSLGIGDICRAYQPNGAVAMYYTEQGRDRISELLARDGMQTQYDNQLFNYSWYGELNGYGLKPGLSPVAHDDFAPSIVQSSKRIDEI